MQVLQKDIDSNSEVLHIFQEFQAAVDRLKGVAIGDFDLEKDRREVSALHERVDTLTFVSDSGSTILGKLKLR